MIKTVTRMLAASAALGLVAAPIMAQANTRAADSSAVYSVSNPGLGRAADGEGQAEGAGIAGFILPVATVTVIVLGTLVATDVIGEDDDEVGDGSPGT